LNRNSMRAQDNDLTDEGWDVRETFAYFGCAYYMASCLEVGLAHALMYGEFMIQEREKLLATKGKGFDQTRYEDDFDAFMDKHFQQTMGGVIRRVVALPDIDEGLKKRIQEARERRNFLAHHYWRERSIKFATPQGRNEMREELATDRDMFTQMDRDLDAAMKPVRAKLRISDEMLERYTEKMMQQIKDGVLEE
jgi:hypothetical protein